MEQRVIGMRIVIHNGTESDWYEDCYTWTLGLSDKRSQRNAIILSPLSETMCREVFNAVLECYSCVPLEKKYPVSPLRL